MRGLHIPRWARQTAERLPSEVLIPPASAKHYLVAVTLGGLGLYEGDRNVLTGASYAVRLIGGTVIDGTERSSDGRRWPVQPPDGSKWQYVVDPLAGASQAK